MATIFGNVNAMNVKQARKAARTLGLVHSLTTSTADLITAIKAA